MRHSYNQKTQQLITLAKEGNGSALDQLCSIYSERVQWMVRIRMGRELRYRMESMDVVQDVLVNALKGLGDFEYKDEGDFVRWLSKIAQNALYDNLDKLHADKRNIHKELPLDGYGPTTTNRFVGNPGPVDITTPSVIMSRREDLAKLAKAIDMLKPEYREVIVLTKIDGLSYSEIGERLNKSPDAVRMLVSRAMASLTVVFKRI